MDGALLESFAAAREVMRRHAHTFYFAAFWLRPERRRATHALYALFRILDDLVDDVAAGQRARETARLELDHWRAWLLDPEHHPRHEPILPAVQYTMDRYAIPRCHFLDLIDGLEMDLDGRRYADVSELALYCFRVASTVGLAMCHVLDARDPAALGHAAELGVAMQITNILRDIREDRDNGRIYLPYNLMLAAGWNDDRLTSGRVNDAFRSMLAGLIALARTYYARGERGIPYLSPDARFAILVAARCYAAILRRIEAMDYDVFNTRAHVSAAGKLRILAGTALQRGGRDDAIIALPPGAPDGIALIDVVNRLRAGLPMPAAGEHSIPASLPLG